MQIVTETLMSWTTLSIINQAAAEICNIKNPFQPKIRYNHCQQKIIPNSNKNKHGIEKQLVRTVKNSTESFSGKKV